MYKQLKILWSLNRKIYHHVRTFIKKVDCQEGKVLKANKNCNNICKLVEMNN